MERCAECGTRAKARTYHRASRRAGGDYRRAARRQQSSICDRCVAEAIADMEVERGSGHDEVTFHPWGACRWDKSDLLRAADRTDLYPRRSRERIGIDTPHDEPTQAQQDAMAATNAAIAAIRDLYGDRLSMAFDSDLARALAAERGVHHRARRDAANDQDG